MAQTSPLLAGLEPAEFLDRYWQKQPFLVRGAVPDSGEATTPELLTALACDASVISRLITVPCADASWKLRHGPFSPADFAALPNDGWTLLVQEIDRHLESFAALLERFRFIPNWRTDDVMLSYATDGAGIGPHLDRYDVFLLQHTGRRRWRISSLPVEERFVEGCALPVLAEFEPDREWLLEPGDMLYLPPRVAHEGVAVGPSVTCSIGFRSPDPRELYTSFLTRLGPEAFEAIRYSDPDLAPPRDLGEIPAAARQRLRDAALRLFSPSGEFDRWVGRFVTRPRSEPPRVSSSTIGSVERLWERLEAGEVLARSSPSHFAWYHEDGRGVQLFVGGERYTLDDDQVREAELLCGSETLDYSALRPSLGRPRFAGVVIDLILRGFLQLKPGVDHEK